MNHKFEHDIKIWLDFAKYDFKSAKWQYKGKFYTSTCYACQQSAEKSLKALALFTTDKIPHIHSLQDLIKIIKQKLDISSIEDDAKELDKYYITTRYPGEYGGPDGLYGPKDAQSAIKSAHNILSFVQHITTT